jgi:acetyl-CoA carboxylase carboxyltransferase component
MAHEYRIPIVAMVEGIGGDVAINDRKGYAPLVSGISIKRSLDLMSEVPVVAMVMGAAAGAAAARAVMSHFSIMVEPTAFIVTAGPPVVRRAMGVNINKFELGGATVHTRNGTIDNPAASEADALAQARRFLSYMPQNAWELPPVVDTADPSDRLVDELLEIMPENPRRGFDARKLVEAVVDRGSFFEVGPAWGRACVTGLARVAGFPVGVICSNPKYLGGAIDAQAADKQARLVDLCDIFHLPIVNFVDVPGVMIGPEAERTSAIRHATRTIQVLYQASVPTVAVYVRRAYGLAAMTSSNPNRLGLRLAWPGTEFGDMPIEGGVEAAYHRQIAAAPDPAGMRKEIEDRMRTEASTWKTAEAFGLEEMIDPAETRRYLARFIEAAQGALKQDVGVKLRAGMRI